jgi:hypothetical protein
LLEAYRYYSWLHLEIVPYLYSYDYAMYETNEPVFRGSHATPEGFVPFAASTLLGNEIFVAYVGEAGVTEIDIDLPSGEWVDYWNPARVFTGPTRITQPVPLGREPIFIRNGSIIPLDVSRDVTGHGTMESSGSLTVWVHPSGASSFRYRDEKEGRWIVLSSSLQNGTLVLDAAPWPNRPVIFRVDGFTSAPAGISTAGGHVATDASGMVPELTTEAAVNGASSNAWFYDAGAKRLTVKIWGHSQPIVKR